MRLILHIGTHKTGTTAVQQFLVDNRPALAQHGFHYAYAGPGPDSNLVANAIALGNPEAAGEFFRRHVDEASRADAQTLIVSAENFYCMAVVAAALDGRMPDDAATQEPLLVQRLQDLLPAELISTEVVCYFRRPDRFAESLYNQRIKYESFDEPFERYLQLVHPMFSYARIASTWADVFGKVNCTFQAYESVQGDIRTAFLRDVLQVSDRESFVDSATRDNERVSRDVLEFKRERNRATPNAERQLEYRIACQLEKNLNLLADEPKDYGEFMSPSARAQFLADLAPDLAELRSSFGLPAFPPLEQRSTEATWTAYPGLADARRHQLQREYDRISRRLRLQRAVRRIHSRT